MKNFKVKRNKFKIYRLSWEISIKIVLNLVKTELTRENNKSGRTIRKL